MLRCIRSVFSRAENGTADGGRCCRRPRDSNLLRVLIEGRHRIVAARPVCPGIAKNSCRRCKRRRRFQRAGGDDCKLQVWCNTGHGAAARAAKYIAKSFRIGHPVGSQELFAGQPSRRFRFDNNDVAGVSGAGCFSTAAAMTVKEGFRIAFDFVGYAATQAAPGISKARHIPLPLMSQCGRSTHDIGMRATAWSIAFSVRDCARRPRTGFARRADLGRL